VYWVVLKHSVSGRVGGIVEAESTKGYVWWKIIVGALLVYIETKQLFYPGMRALQPSNSTQAASMLFVEPEGGFTAIVPALPGCVTYGRTLAEARTMAKDAISGYIESLKKAARSLDPWNNTVSFSIALREAIFIFFHPLSKRRAVVPKHNRDLPKGTLLSLLREAGFTREEMIAFLGH
jgi:antitoxin HicB